jgi:hypothetical protein
MGKQIAASYISVLRMASGLMREHGKDASTVATLEAEKYISKGDMDGYRLWKRVEMVVDEMLTSGPPDSMLVH